MQYDCAPKDDRSARSVASATPSHTGWIAATVALLAVLVAVPSRAPAGRAWRTIDGRTNNLEHPDLGSAGIPLLRLTPTAYADGIAAPAGPDRPSPRTVSNAICPHGALVPNAAAATDLFWQRGQFLDHDIDLTPAMEPREPLPIPVPIGDPFFDPHGTGCRTIPFDRSAYDPTVCCHEPRQQINALTAFIDASNVYGSDPTRALALRRLDGSGRLKTSRRRMLPFNRDGHPNVGGPRQDFFLAGDVRANEQIGLAAMHTIFVREHNRQARRLRRRAPHLSDTEIYEGARAIVGAQMQVITYNEFLPVLLGPGALRPYAGYDPSVNLGVANVFSTAAFRFGHSMLSPSLVPLNRDLQPGTSGPLALRDAFFSPHLLLHRVRTSELLRGLAHQIAQDVDPVVIDEIRNFLFGPPGAGGLDLAALNIQRGRDHGLPDCNRVRTAFGLTPATTFADVTADGDMQARLRDCYGTVDAIDVWIGGLAEDHVPGALVGELFFTITADQFERLRDGDRFWYQRMFSGPELAALERTTLARIIRRNTRAGHEIPDDVFTRTD